MTKMQVSRHDHVFGQDRKRPGELRTPIVVLLTAATMIIEIAAGMIGKDLDKAKIARENKQGIVDFHSLRVFTSPNCASLSAILKSSRLLHDTARCN